jgi:hypothetical protein
VCEDVGADLRQCDLEVHDVGVIRLSAGGLAQELDGFMKLLQTFIKLAERGVELKGLRTAPHDQNPVRASSTVE